MALTVQPYPGNLIGLADSVEGALYTFDDTSEATRGLIDQQLALHGPFPVYTSRPDNIEDDQKADGSVLTERTGWRALVTAEERPVVLVDIVFGSDGVERFNLRGPEAANAFGRLLRLATAHIDGDAAFDVRWFTVPDVYVSALWLASPDSIFLPSRLGSTVRVEGQEMSWPMLRERVLPLIEGARPGADFVERDDGSPRSGLSRRG